MLQTTTEEASRHWSEFATTTSACECILVFYIKLKKDLISLYEKRLKELNPGVRSIQYSVKDFNNYLDHLQDACALVFDSKQLVYSPKDKEWLKEKVKKSRERLTFFRFFNCSKRWL